MKPMPQKKPTLREGHPCCVKCHSSMSRNRKSWFCRKCPKTYVEAHFVASSRRQATYTAVRPCCIRCRCQMQKKAEFYLCVDCRVSMLAHAVPRLCSSNPYCLSCRRQMCSSGTAGNKGFQCSGCLMGVQAHITSYGRLSVLPWCLYCRRRMQRYHGAREGFAASFMCPNCRMSTREYLVRYRPVPPQRPLRLMKIAESVLPSGLDPEVRQEARAALLCDLLAGEVKPSKLDPATVRRYVRAAQVTNYADVRLDAVLPSGSRLVDLMAG